MKIIYTDSVVLGEDGYEIFKCENGLWFMQPGWHGKLIEGLAVWVKSRANAHRIMWDAEQEKKRAAMARQSIGLLCSA